MTDTRLPQIGDLDVSIAMHDLLVDYERWEGDIVLAADWDTKNGLPLLTQELYDRMMELQAKRNAILRPLRGKS